MKHFMSRKEACSAKLSK